MIYHGIDLHGKTDFNTRFISADYFEKQIAFFSKHFNVVSLDDIYGNRVAQDKLNVAITFDDGYQNNLKYAVPILEKHQVAATFFVTGIRDLGTDILWPDLEICSRWVANPSGVYLNPLPTPGNGRGRHIRPSCPHGPE